MAVEIASVPLNLKDRCVFKSQILMFFVSLHIRRNKLGRAVERKLVSTLLQIFVRIRFLI
jgi:hypothetical protein